MNTPESRTCLIVSFFQSHLPITYEDIEAFGIPNINWSSCGKFTSENGIKQIEEFISVGYCSCMSIMVVSPLHKHL